MDIRVTLDSIVSIQDGETNINEILHAVGKLGSELTLKIAQGVIEAYQRRGRGGT